MLMSPISQRRNWGLWNPPENRGSKWQIQDLSLCPLPLHSAGSSLEGRGVPRRKIIGQAGMQLGQSSGRDEEAAAEECGVAGLCLWTDPSCPSL